MEEVPCAFVILKFVILVFIGAHGGTSMCFCNFEICNFGIHPAEKVIQVDKVIKVER